MEVDGGSKPKSWQHANPGHEASRARQSQAAVLKVLGLLSAVALTACDAPASQPLSRPGSPRLIAPGSLAAAGSSGIDEEYVYDKAGNFTEIRSATSPLPLAITAFTPEVGGVGQVVAVSGTGFSPMAQRNAVRLNDVPVQVTSASAQLITFTVPPGASTGRVTIAVGTSTATSASDFTVLPTVTVLDFSPRMGKPGTTLSIAGANFGSSPELNFVHIGAGAGAITSASDNSLTATVGPDATSGKVVVRAPNGTATSDSDFVLLPASVVESEVASIGRLTPGMPTPVSIGSAGKKVLLLTDGVKGQSRSLLIAGLTIAGNTSVTLYDPAGTALLTTSVSPGRDVALALPRLPRSGTYEILLAPQPTSAGAATLTIFDDAGAPVDPRGSAVGVTLPPGQNGRLAFVGRPGDRLSVGLTSSQCTPVTSIKLSLLDAAGKTLATGTTSSAGTWVLPMLTSPGTHQIWIQPSIPATCSIALAVSPVVEGSLPADGSVLTHQTGRAGQTARYTFSASAGESYTIQATVGNTYSKGVALTVNKPDGTGLASMTVAGGATGKLNLPNLPSTGSYVVALAPVDASAGAVDLRFVPHAVGTLAPGDLEKTLVLGVAQNGRYTFAGVAGDSLALTYTGVSTAPSGQRIALTVVRPEGTALQSISVSAPGSTQLTTLPVSGTYVLTAAPAGVSGTCQHE